MMEFLYLSLLIACVNGFPNSALIKDITSLKDGNAFKEMYDIIRSPEVQRSLQDSQKIAEAFLSGAADVSPKNPHCACCGYNCGCCLHFEQIGLNSTGCVNVTYQPAPYYGVLATLTINGKTIINESVSARNPPPICADVPYLKELASVCLRFYNITVVTSTSFSACLKVEARLEHLPVKDIDIGCFDIPPKRAQQGGEPCESLPKDNKGRQPGYTTIQDSQSLKHKAWASNRVPEVFVNLHRN